MIGFSVAGICPAVSLSVISSLFTFLVRCEIFVVSWPAMASSSSVLRPVEQDWSSAVKCAECKTDFDLFHWKVCALDCFGRRTEALLPRPPPPLPRPPFSPSPSFCHFLTSSSIYVVRVAFISAIRARRDAGRFLSSATTRSSASATCASSQSLVRPFSTEFRLNSFIILYFQTIPCLLVNSGARG